MASPRDADPRGSSPDVSDGARDETPSERADRNWTEILQELRVLQTGTQILTGFLLALAFQPGFADLSTGQRSLYLALVVLAALSTIIALAPVALHRALFQRKAKERVVSFGHIGLVAALVTVAFLLIGVVAFVFDVVLDGTAAWVAVAALGIVLLSLWIVGHAFIRTRHSAKDTPR